MNAKTIIGVIFLMLSTRSAIAAEHGIILNLGSKHIVSFEGSFNETNLGLGYTNYINDTTAIQLGFYNNSYNDLSTYMGLKFYGRWMEVVKPFLSIALVTGYEEIPVAPIPAVGIDVEVIKTHKLNFMLAPLFVFSMDNNGDSQTDVGILLAVQYEKMF